MVLAVAGNWRQPHAVPQATAALPDWLDSAVRSGGTAEAGHAAGAAAATPSGGVGGNGSSSWVHKDSLEAAEALLAELDSRQLLHQLLRPSTSSGGSAGAGSGGGEAGEAAAGLAGLDCAGWRLVVCGHGLGAGAAALLALKLQAMQLGECAGLAGCASGSSQAAWLAVARVSNATSMAQMVLHCLAEQASPLPPNAPTGSPPVGLGPRPARPAVQRRRGVRAGRGVRADLCRAGGRRLAARQRCVPGPAGGAGGRGAGSPAVRGLLEEHGLKVRREQLWGWRVCGFAQCLELSFA